MTVEEILARLIAFPTVVGTPNDAIVDWIREYCQAVGAEVTVHPGPEGDRSNLFATIGPREGRGYILSGHMDVVPAGEQEWHSVPFVLRREGEVEVLEVVRVVWSDGIGMRHVWAAGGAELDQAVADGGFGVHQDHRVGELRDGALRKDQMVKKWLATWDEVLESKCENLAGEEVEIDDEKAQEPVEGERG